MGYFITFSSAAGGKKRFIYLRDWQCVLKWLKRMERKCTSILIEKEEKV